MGNQSVSKFKWSLFAVSALLGAMLTIQMTSGKNKESNFAGADIIQVKNALAYESTHHEQLLEQINKMERKLQVYESSPGNQESVLAKMKDDLNKAKVEAGLTPLEGNGIRIEIKEDPTFSIISPSPRDPHEEKYHIFDHELVYLVNILQSNGARAVSFNNQRVVTSTGIREIGVSKVDQIIYPGTMQVNFNVVTLPYVIDAVGDIDKMKGAVLTYIGEDFFRSKGKALIITEYRDGKKLVLPPYTRSPNYQFTTEDKAEGAAKK
ncbi:DUF881 domain-containing protein [Effusibacillus consociatus]|uniref:DUF881 domain-containing protein n=1 Tax=Effusibacillus consociatus TaxID=1117041 RepID=A0ABV9Q896_9BACL